MSRRRTNGIGKSDDVKLVRPTDGIASSRPRRRNTRSSVASIASAIVDYSFVVSLVFGGCCTNVWAYEELLRMEPSVGAALTFSQMVFITTQQLPSFTQWQSPQSWVPTLKPRQVPIWQWLLQVGVFASGSLLNNMAFAFNVPLTVQIVFRSAGLAVSMLLGRFVLHKQYTVRQMTAVSFVSCGVILATLYRPSARTAASGVDGDVSRYALGVLMLTASLLCTGVLGLLQERTYQKYGPCWQEGVFYTHALSLPLFLFMIPQVKNGLGSLSTHADPSHHLPIPYVILALNLLSQLICVSGVNQLSSRLSSVSTQVVLTTRKALSLCFSVWWFGSGWNLPLGAGATMVFVGSFWYSLVSAAPRRGPKKA